jgi:membrane protein YqaA with SNARE-associated domain
MVEELIVYLVTTFGYLGVFLASMIGSATIFLPVPSFLLTVAGGAVLDPFFVALAAGTGAAIGELVGYGVGYGIGVGHKKLTRKKGEKKWMKTIKSWFQKKYGVIVIFIFAATPLPDDVVGLFCGIIKYDIKKYFVATLAGKIVLHLALAYAGFYGIGLVGRLL